MNVTLTPAESTPRRPRVQIRTADDSTRRRRLLLATPAAVFGSIFLALTTAFLARPQEPSTPTLECRADLALASGDYATAKVQYQRLIQRDSTSARYREGYAIASRTTNEK